MKIFLFSVLAALACSALAQPKVVDGVLTDSKGMTLYVWDNDLTVPGKIQCVGVCVMSWPPMLAGPADTPTGEYTLMVREDGKKQWAYKGRPLYLWVNDKKPGDRTGDGFRAGTWHLVRP